MAGNATELETAPRLRAAVGKLGRMLRRADASASLDISPTGVGVLMATDKHGEIRLAELGEREGLNPTLLSRTVANLVSIGLLERRSDPEDRRSAWVAVTTEGAATAKRIRVERTVAVQTAMDALDKSDRALIEAALPALERLADQLAGCRR